MKREVSHYYQKSMMRISAVILSSILLCSFVVHAQDTHHTHPGNTETHQEDTSSTQSLSEYAHGSEKKYFLLPKATALLVALPDFFLTEFSMRVPHFREVFDLAIVFWEEQLFAQGILNTKLYL